MDLMHLVTYITLLLYLLFGLIAETTARPFTDLDTFISTPLDIDRQFRSDFVETYQTRPVSSRDSLLSRLRRGYYYIDEGKIIPVNPTGLNKNVQIARRREDNFSNERLENAKPKKLFVPNLFG